jgi:hypothetical protein
MRRAVFCAASPNVFAVEIGSLADKFVTFFNYQGDSKMASFNRVILVGNLTKDVELRHIQSSGTAVTDISLAVNENILEKKKRGAGSVHVVSNVLI